MTAKKLDEARLRLPPPPASSLQLPPEEECLKKIFSPLGGHYFRWRNMRTTTMYRTMPTTLQGHTRIAFLCFFISHIPITLLIDSQALFPRHYYPQILRVSLDWYASTFKDELMTLTPSTSSPIWFKSLVAIEIMFQLPFFFLAIYAILHAPQQPQQQQQTNNPLIRGDGIFRSLCLIYSTSTVTTLIPIYISIATSQLATTRGEKGLLLCFYAPYFIFPAWLLIIALCEENVFQSQQRSSSTSKMNKNK